MMVTEDYETIEYAGLLQRDATGFFLQCDDGERYRLELLRTPIDEVEKWVVVTGRIIDSAILETEGIRLA
ncbi:DUF5818 domain-containing protein [uncultured Parasphingorhabdus sp.]|uniref:DUF5818 domain-containing protein n=1 Tax=uncultured Parasphingorhabdus sp. TaxID=2709694 RepID=UPI0030DAEE12|tara:strand:- start:22420 stop:22629 length:210 start_codon:yes stop_codon:yes gene_type:complete